MKTHDSPWMNRGPARASLLVGCLGVALLYLPDGIRLAAAWPAPPGWEPVEPLAQNPDEVRTVAAPKPILRAQPVVATPGPVETDEPLRVDDLMITPASFSAASYMGGR